MHNTKSLNKMSLTVLSQPNSMIDLPVFRFLGFLTVVMIFVITGCTATNTKTRQQQLAERRYFWPPLPDTPRIEFITSYKNTDDFPKTGKQVFLESLVGATEVRGFTKPWGLVSDGEGKIYVADVSDSQVTVLDLSNNKIEGMGKQELEGVFDTPIDVALDKDGNIYVSDSQKNRVFVFTKDEKPLTAIGDEKIWDWPGGLAIDDKLGRLYGINGHKHSIEVFELSGKHLFTIGKRGDGPGEFNYPTDLDIDSQGNLVVADAMNARIQILDPDGKFIRKIGRRGDGGTDFQLIKGIAVDRKTDNIYVVDGRGGRFIIFDKEGTPLLSVGGTVSVFTAKKISPAGFLLPAGISIDKKGRIYVADSLNHRIQVFQIIDDEWLREHPVK